MPSNFYKAARQKWSKMWFRFTKGSSNHCSNESQICLTPKPVISFLVCISWERTDDCSQAKFPPSGDTSEAPNRDSDLVSGAPTRIIRLVISWANNKWKPRASVQSVSCHRGGRPAIAGVVIFLRLGVQSQHSKQPPAWGMLCSGESEKKRRECAHESRALKALPTCRVVPLGGNRPS